MEQHVDLPEVLLGGRDRGGHRLLVGDIDLQRQRDPAREASSSASWATAGLSRSRSASLAPSLANRRAAALPRPPAAPVIKTVRLEPLGPLIAKALEPLIPTLSRRSREKGGRSASKAPSSRPRGEGGRRARSGEWHTY